MTEPPAAGSPADRPPRRRARAGCGVSALWLVGGAALMALFGALIPVAIVALVGVLLIGGSALALSQAATRWRRVARTATSTLRGAAQGVVELAGEARAIGDAPATAPLSGGPAIVARARIERHEARTRRRGGRRSTTVGWFSIWQETHDEGAVLIADADGRACAVFTDHQPLRGRKTVWRVRGQDGVDALPPGVLARFPALTDGRRYRLTEEVVRPGDPLIGIGTFRTFPAETFPFDRGMIARALDDLHRRPPPERWLIRLIARIAPAGLDGREVAIRRTLWDRVCAHVAAHAPPGERTRIPWLLEDILAPGTPLLAVGDERALRRRLRRQTLTAAAALLGTVVVFGAIGYAVIVSG